MSCTALSGRAGGGGAEVQRLSWGGSDGVPVGVASGIFAAAGPPEPLPDAGGVCK